MSGHDPSGGDPTSAVDAVVDRLKAFIVLNGLSSGDRLPPERQLATDMQVSRNTIREAVGALARLGVVEVRRGAGAFVTDSSSQSMLQGIAFMIEVSPIDRLIDFLTLRRVVEAEAASLAATRIGADDLDELRGCLDAMSVDAATAAAQPDDDVAADVRFHAIIAAAAGNQPLVALSTALNSMTFRSRISAGMYRSSAPFLGARAEHEPLYQAIADRDPSRAGALAAAHVAAVEHALRRALADAPAAP